MTITIPQQSHHHNVRVAAIALTFVVVLAVSGLTFWQSSAGSNGDASAAIETVQAEPFSPEKARISTQAPATASVGTAGSGHPDVHTVTGEPGASTPVAQNTSATAASFAALDAPTELKDYALAQSISDWVVDYEKATRILQSFTRGIREPVEVQAVEPGGITLDVLPSNCTSWVICESRLR